ncbi:MAG: hypothetical protein CFE23_16250 [Flavobacterium sp. BFFFF1]|uniref:ATP-binding protein n=1 Tax=Flavobacterium sp. BFFFF1 TaxID=2015557 RepID=UPI000BCB0E42|nr:ATP-binding protein [Flavobacterium sp. BFFFF1]OYU78964.1 MAG: hypothetical protein CFE23_16250 [Flavobacterium sp. BFFFF1]
MKFTRIFRFSNILKLTLAIAIIAIGYLTTMFYFQMRELETSVKAIANSNNIQFELEQISTQINKNESALRSFIITKDSLFLKDRFLDKREFDLRMSKLQELSLKSPESRLEIDSLAIKLNQRFAIFNAILTAASINNYDVNTLKNNLLRSNILSDNLQSYLNAVISRQQHLVNTQHKLHSKRISESSYTAVGLAITCLLIFGLAYSKMKNDIIKVKKANDDLKFLNETFNNAEKIASFGHWKVNLDTKVYTLSDNFYRLLGREPQSFEASLETITELIHPDDREAAIRAHMESLIDLKPTSITCRYVLDNGEIKYLKSVGSFRRNTKGQLVKIGVNSDITQQFLDTKKLSENNQKLVEINAELESFNSIVSHDMQEPLRKIQMFISRLEANEMENMTEQGKDYFNKIRFSANRMQNLMVDLVNYARAVKGDRTFVKTDLNVLMKVVVEELSLSIDEKNATVKVDDLPTIEGIPFQIQQLFVNLISNSIKYSRINVDPEILVRNEKIAENTFFDNKLIDPKSYYKIVVSDNGIGFRQEYAENIFMLFRRLETDKNYSGTGLGLAICKKIAENHNGFILAYGKQQIGAEFHVYLPKESTV